jgi:hypothetical protein
MKRGILFTGLTIAGSMIFTGCAGMFSGETQSLTIKSNVDGATVELNGRIIGKTPLTTVIEKKKDLLLTLKKDGYQDVSQPLNTTFDPMAIVGIMSYGLPITTDVQKGTAYQITPNYYQIEMSKKH